MKQQMSDDKILELIKQTKPEPLPEKWVKEEDMNPNYLGGFLTAFKLLNRFVTEIDAIEGGNPLEASSIDINIFDLSSVAKHRKDLNH
jgi:hypothetical protein